jgi:ribosomal protein S18 acetylase RimI-like enzyme
MYKYLTLENTSYQLLFDAFIESFQGFRIVAEATFEDFCTMLNNNGYDPAISIGAFTSDTGELAGFILNSMKELESKKTAYIILTGTKPLFRRQGLMKTIFRQIRQLLLDKKVKLYTTEVLLNNEPALKLYQSQGFTIKGEVTTVVTTSAGSRELIQYEMVLDLGETT